MSLPTRPISRRATALVAALVMLVGAIPGVVGLDHPPQAVNRDEWHFVQVAMRTAN